MKTVAIVGYSNSGKSTVIRALLAEAKQRGLRAAVIKVGHRSRTHAAEVNAPAAGGKTTDSDGPGSQLRDSESFAAEGADPVVFRTSDGWTAQLYDPLEPRTEPLRIPPWLKTAMQSVDLLLVEGRRVDGAVLVQTVGEDGRLKFDPEECSLVLRDAPRNPLPSELATLLWG